VKARRGLKEVIDARSCPGKLRRAATACYTGFTPQWTGRISLTQKPKAEVLPPRNAMALDTLAGVRGEMARLYRLALNGRIQSDEMTKFVYVLRELRGCIEAEMLIDVQQRLAVLSRDRDNHNGQRIPHQPAFSRS
jgi:hypothetical protein